MSFRLEIDPITCDGRGLCAELFPERVRLDDWGYPMIDPTPFDGPLLGPAKAAVNACPVLALRLARVEAEKRPQIRTRTIR
jgi:ferredoxin